MNDDMSVKELWLQFFDSESEFWAEYMYIQNCMFFDICKLIAG